MVTTKLLTSIFLGRFLILKYIPMQLIAQIEGSDHKIFVSHRRDGTTCPVTYTGTKKA